MKKPRARFSRRQDAALRTGLTAGYLALSTADTLLAARDETSRWRWITKPLLMPVLIAATAQEPGNEMAPSTYVGLAASGVGDLILLNRSQPAFFAAMGAFGVGHLSYISGVLPLRDRSTPLAKQPATKAAAGVLTLSIPVAARAARKSPALGAAVAGYAVLLSGHAAVAGAIDPARLPARNRRERLAGASMFLLSDALIGLGKFVLKKRSPATEGGVMATYTSAQWLLAESARRSAVRAVTA